jgi:PncC family amidohydrolase
MQELIARANKVARLLKHRGETIAVAESSTGGLIAAALLALPGASAYFLGGAVVYTQVAQRALLDLADISSLGIRASTEPYARLLAQTVRQRFSASWAVAESGATGPAGNRYGDAPGHPPARQEKVHARQNNPPVDQIISAACRALSRLIVE